MRNLFVVIGLAGLLMACSFRSERTTVQPQPSNPATVVNTTTPGETTVVTTQPATR